MGSAMNCKTFLMLLLFMQAVNSINILAAQDSVGAAPQLHPDPVYSPEEVARIQTEALGNNDKPYADAGIEITFRFASPQNKLITGPLAHFIGIVRSPAYALMIDHASAEFGPPYIEGDFAQVPVLLTAANGEQTGYVFRLSRQSEAPFEQCWMTDGVVRMSLKNSNGGTQL